MICFIIGCLIRRAAWSLWVVPMVLEISLMCWLIAQAPK